jgi:ferredoxin--NADP+ reductase
VAFAITQACCNDASCLSVCPVNCIHPTPGEPDFGTTDLLHVDPRACIDCGACADVCPVEAITHVSRLSPEQAVYADINAAYYADRSTDPVWDAPRFPPAGLSGVRGVRVAVVGTGPAACYAVQSLLRTADVRVTMVERLSTPGGLARFGVAPDHLATRRIAEHFAPVFTHPRVTLRLGTEVGRDVSAAELARDHDAVLWAVGADGDRELGVPGEHLPGSLSARTLVGWYTGHPGVPADAVDLAGVARVVLVGNGNVAVDVARILTADPEALAGTDIAPHALAALRRHRVREVVLVARRGPEHAAFTRPEALALTRVPGVEVVVDDSPGVGTALDALPATASASAVREAKRVAVDWTVPPPPGRRVVLTFGRTPTAVTAGADGRVASVQLATGETVPALLVVAATGYRGTALDGVPFDPSTATVRNHAGRVLDDAGAVVPGQYVVGWARRGTGGGIGDNRADAEEVVRALLTDVAAAPRPSARRRLPFAPSAGFWSPSGAE